MRILVLYVVEWLVLPVLLLTLAQVGLMHVAEALGLRCPPPRPPADPLAVEAPRPTSSARRRHS